MRAYRLPILVALGMCLCGARLLHADDPAVSEAPSALRIVAEHYPPYDYAVDGVATGINVEVTARIMKRIGVPYRYEPGYPFSRAWALLRSGHADAVPNVSCQPHRRAHMYGSLDLAAAQSKGRMPTDYLWITRYVFFVRQQLANAVVFTDYKQLSKDGLRVGICKDYSYDGRLLKAGLETKMFVGPQEGLRALARGDIDLFPMDETIGHWLVRELGLSESVSVLPRTIFEKPYMMAFSKGSRYPGIEEVWRKFCGELRKMRDSGEYAEIVNRYIPPAYQYPLRRPLLFVAEQWAPFEYIRDEELVGIDVEVVRRVMGRLNLPYEIRLYPWSRALMLAERGHADAVLSISYKDSRENLLYYTQDQRDFASTGALPENFLWMSEYVFFVKASRLEDLKFESYEQLKRDGIRVGTNSDYSYCPEFLRADLSHRDYPDTRSGMAALISEDIDMYPMDGKVGMSELKEMGLSDSVTFIPTPMFSKPYLCPFVRGSEIDGLEAVMNAFYRELHILRMTGEYDDIVSAFQRR